MKVTCSTAVTSVEVDFTSESFKEAQARDVAPGEEQMQTDVAPPPMEKAELKSETETPTPPLPAVENPDVALQTEPEEARGKERRGEGEDPERVAAAGVRLDHHGADCSRRSLGVRRQLEAQDRAAPSAQQALSGGRPGQTRARHRAGGVPDRPAWPRRLQHDRPEQRFGRARPRDARPAAARAAAAAPARRTSLAAQFSFNVPVRFDLQ